MKRIALILLCIIAFTTASAQIRIVKDGTSDFVVQASNHDTMAYHAAETLCHYIQQATGCRLPIVESCGNNHHAILIYTVPGSQDDDGFGITTEQNKVHIRASQGRGLLYGVYELLEQYVGMRMYTPDAITIPQSNDISIPNIDTIVQPSFNFRDVLYWYPNTSQRYANFHRLHNTQDLNREWGMFVHTFRHLIPAERYFEKHPEWFSETEGRRLRDGQLCLSNPEVLEELCKNLDSMMQRRPEAKIWSVSNNDNYNVCTCPECRKMDSLYGGPSGTLIHFINQVAERFPDKIISTLGYQFTRRAPQSKIKPRNNVNIMFCSIECDRSKPLTTAEGEAQFRKDMEDWAEKTDNIFMWDYVVQFRNMMAPFPNLHVLQPNLQFFHNHGVRLMFEQGCSSTPTAWMELRNYLIAKLMWNVNADVDSLMRDFCQGYYDQAGTIMYDLYKRMESELISSGKRLDIYGYPADHREGFLNPGLIAIYKEQLANAYNSVAGDSILTSRIRFWELSLDYAILEMGLGESNISEYRQLAERFVDDCKLHGVKILMEMGITPAEYLVQINNYLDKIPSQNKAYNCHVTLKEEPDKRYSCQGAKSLTDGKIGLLNYFSDWLGFYGKALDATIDLGQKTEVNEVMMDFYKFPLSWIFVPETVEVFVSKDGKHWKHIGQQHAQPTGTDMVALAKPNMQHFSFKADGKPARYVRVVATPLAEIPQWHRAAGKPCWTFCDEIVIK